MVKRIVVLTPRYKDVDEGARESLKKAKKELKDKYEIRSFTASGTAVHINRIFLFKEAIDLHLGDWPLDYVLWLDSDISFEPSDVETLVEFIESGKGQCVSGEYFSRYTDLGSIAWGGSPEKGIRFGTKWEINKHHKVYACGTGFFMMSVNAAEIYRKSYHLTELFEYPGWQRNPSGKRKWLYLGEDVDFCWKLQKVGFDVWLDTHVQLTHAGINRFNFKDKSIPRTYQFVKEEEV